MAQAPNPMQAAPADGMMGTRWFDSEHHTNGYRDRSLDTRLGPLSLRIPKLR
jgi:Transposase, Mutator family